MQVVGGPYDGTDIDRPIPSPWVYLLPDGRLTKLPRYAEVRGGLLHRVIPMITLDPVRHARGGVLFYVGDMFMSCPECGAFFYLRDGGSCSLCANRTHA